MNVVPPLTVNAPPLKAKAPVLVKVVVPAPPNLILPLLQLMVPVVVLDMLDTYAKSDWPGLVLVMVPLLLIVPYEPPKAVVLVPVIFHVALLVIVGKLKKLMTPFCQSNIPLFVMLATKDFAVAVVRDNVPAAPIVVALPKVPPDHTEAPLRNSIPDPLTVPGKVIELLNVKSPGPAITLEAPRDSEIVPGNTSARLRFKFPSRIIVPVPVREDPAL